MESVSEIIESIPCCGCGACAALAPEALEMTDLVHEVRRPHFRLEMPHIRTLSASNMRASAHRTTLRRCSETARRHRDEKRSLLFACGDK